MCPAARRRWTGVGGDEIERPRVSIHRLACRQHVQRGDASEVVGEVPAGRVDIHQSRRRRAGEGVDDVVGCSADDRGQFGGGGLHPQDRGEGQDVPLFGLERVE